MNYPSTHHGYEMGEWLNNVANSLVSYTEHDDFVKIRVHRGKNIKFFHKEVENLTLLNKQGCDFVPTLKSSRILMSGTFRNDYGKIVTLYFTEIIMERIQGKTIDELYDLPGNSDDNLSWNNFPHKDLPENLRLCITDLMDKLEYVYHVLYLDRHHGNVMIDNSGKVWIIDFEL